MAAGAMAQVIAQDKAVSAQNLRAANKVVIIMVGAKLAACVMTDSNNQKAAEPKPALEFTTGLRGRLAGAASRM